MPGDHLSLDVSLSMTVLGLPRWCSGKEPPCQCRRCKRRGFHPWVGTIPWRRLWQGSPVFLPGKSQDRGAWRVTFHGVAKTETQLSSHPTQPPSVSPAFSCQEQSVAARISGRPLAAPRLNLITFLSTHPSLFYTHPFTSYILEFPLSGFHSSPMSVAC